MIKIFGKKLKMTQVWEDNGRVAGVTVVKVDNSEDLSSPQVGDLVKVSGISKGRGFQGVVKRHGFHGGPQTHGQKNRLRAPGSIGSTAPQRVLPGRRMAGHMGVERVSYKNLRIVKINNEDQTVLINGAVSGNRGVKVEIVKSAN